jgi:UDP-N-acetylglucosamine 2-epimerase (non-hydrolysing)
MLIAGTRPEIIKMAPLIRKIKNDELLFVYTGQHHDYNLSVQFIKDLSLPPPHAEFSLQNNKPALQISEVISNLQKVLSDLPRPDILCVEGDTNTVLASSIFAVKNNIPLGHIEAGLRSYDWRMPEEHNRIAVDHISDILFAPTKIPLSNLRKENVHGRIFVTGNTIIDALNQNLPIAIKRSKMLIPSEDYVLLTLHRAENVDNPEILSNIIDSIRTIPMTIIFPLHPRTRMNLRKFGLEKKMLDSENIRMIQPLGYFDFLKLMKYCKFIVTDSGGIQEEATAPSIRKLVLVVRNFTERPEAVHGRFAKVIGTESKIMRRVIKQVIDHHIEPPHTRQSPFGNGNSAERIYKLIYRFINNGPKKIKI